jgi:UDP-N-acetylmuramate dehydrogenase
MVDAEAPQKAAATIAQREKRHLQNVACAGSYFMNPVAPQWVQDEFAVEKGAQPREGRVPAGWLIEKVGLRGYTVGNAASSAMHANYLVNNGGATAAEVRAVAGHIQDMIQKKYMTYLHEEPTLVGFHSA